MHTITFSLHYEPPRVSYCETARQTYQALRTMSTQTKARLEMIALVLGLVLTVVSAVRVFIYLPSRVDAVEKVQGEHTAELKAIQIKSSATDVAIAGIVPQLTAINQGITEIKGDIRDIRNAK